MADAVMLKHMELAKARRRRSYATLALLLGAPLLSGDADLLGAVRLLRRDVADQQEMSHPGHCLDRKGEAYSPIRLPTMRSGFRWSGGRAGRVVGLGG
jgi:hypothetical protein